MRTISRGSCNSLSNGRTMIKMLASSEIRCSGCHFYYDEAREYGYASSLIERPHGLLVRFDYKPRHWSPHLFFLPDISDQSLHESQYIAAHWLVCIQHNQSEAMGRVTRICLKAYHVTSLLRLGLLSGGESTAGTAFPLRSWAELWSVRASQTYQLHRVLKNIL